MTSNLISRLLPPRSGSPSVYETLRQHDDSDGSDLEERAGMALDEANLREGSDDYDLGRVDGAALDGSHLTTDSAALMGEHPTLGRRDGLAQSTRRPKWMTQSRRLAEPDEGDDEVPPSLLTEGVDALRDPTSPFGDHLGEQPTVQASLSNPQTHFEAIHTSPSAHPRATGTSERRRSAVQTKLGLAMVDPKERALWRWANVENLDNFLKDVYDYFLGNGIWCIMLSRVLNLL